MDRDGAQRERKGKRQPQPLPTRFKYGTRHGLTLDQKKAGFGQSVLARAAGRIEKQNSIQNIIDVMDRDGTVRLVSAPLFSDGVPYGTRACPHRRIISK
jgi:hypothetical protein